MKSVFFYILLLATSLAAIAQDYSYEFKKITSNEVNLKSYEKDKDAPALILYDIGKTSIIENHDGGLELQFEHRRKIKIFNQAGYEYAEIELPFYVKNYKKEQVVDIEAYTYNQTETGVIRTPLEPSKIYEEAINDRWRVKKFAFPKVKDGSIIEYKYKFITPHITDYQDWEFQQDIPVKYSKYEALMNPFYSFAWYLQGATKFNTFRDYVEEGLPQYYAGIEYKHKVYEFGMIDIPAFYDEGYITSRNDYIMKINFQLAEINHPNGAKIQVLSTWPKLAKNMLSKQDLGGFKNSVERKANKMLEEINLTETDELKITEIISEYIKSNYEWNGRYGYIPIQTAKEFLSTKSGNCSEINLLLTGLLNEAGITAYPVLISTRSNGKIKIDYPYLETFNYLAVLADFSNGKSLLLDATERNLPYHILPTRCINDDGLVLRKDQEQWASLISEYPSSIKYNLIMKLNENLDSLDGENSIISDGYIAFFHRNKLHDNYTAQKKYFTKKDIYLKSKAKSLNFDRKNLPFTLAFRSSTPVENVFDKIYISPFAKIPPEENPFKQPERKYPIDFTYANKRIFNSYITIPEGYTTDFLPEGKEIHEPNFNLSYRIVVNDNIIQIQAEYEFTKAVYEANEYSLLKQYFNQIVKKLNEKIVLKKLDS